MAKLYRFTPSPKIKYIHINMMFICIYLIFGLGVKRYDVTSQPKLDESTARRQLKSPRSQSGRSIHLTLVTKWSWSWSGQGHGQDQNWRPYLRPRSSINMFVFSFRGNRTIFGWDIANSIFDLENSRSRSWPRSNPMVTFEPYSSIDMIAFRFVEIRPFLTEI